MKRLLCILLLLCAAFVQAAPVKIASLHPLLSDMARQIGGNKVKVHDLFPENGTLHEFQPTSNEISRALGSKLLLAMGKGVEPYLPSLRSSISEKTKFVELGATIPDVKVPGTDKVDPHWWNSPANMKRASRVLLEELSAVDPTNKSYYEKRQKKYAEEMDSLMMMGRLMLSKVPADRRILVTEHAAMCHFCEAFNLTPMALQGVAAEAQGDPATLARLLTELREKKVPSLFTEYNSSPRNMRVIASQLGVATFSLVMDGIAKDLPTYEQQMTHNIGAVMAGLSNSKKKPATVAESDEDIAGLLNDIQNRAEEQARREVEEERAKAAAGKGAAPSKGDKRNKRR